MDFKNWSNGRTEASGNVADEATIKSKIEQYSGKSEEELFSLLRSEIGKKRANGTLRENDLEQLKSQLAPFLTAEQLNRLNEVLKLLK